jgi:acyl carrier protein
MNTDLVEKLKVELIEQLNLEEITSAEIDPAAPLFGDGLGLDSIDALEIIVLLEKEYGIKITDQALGKEAMQSINSLAAFIKSNSK